MIKDYVVLDLETTGLDPKKDRIIEIGALRVRNGETCAIMKTYVNQGRKIPERITEITGITDVDIKGAPPYEEVIPELLEFLGDDVLIGHCILFDYSFLKRGAVNLRKDYDPRALDTLKIARTYLPELESRSLPFLCEHYHIEYLPHRAFEDAQATSKLYQVLCGEFEERVKTESEETADVFVPRKMIYQVKKEAPIREHQVIKLRELHKKHHIEPDYDINSLTKNEASRFIDQLLATYGR